MRPPQILGNWEDGNHLNRRLGRGRHSMVSSLILDSWSLRSLLHCKQCWEFRGETWTGVIALCMVLKSMRFDKLTKGVMREKGDQGPRSQPWDAPVGRVWKMWRSPQESEKKKPVM